MEILKARNSKFSYFQHGWRMKCTSCRWTTQNGKRWIHHFKSKLWKIEQTILTGGKILNNRCWPNIQCFNGTHKPIKSAQFKTLFLQQLLSDDDSEREVRSFLSCHLYVKKACCERHMRRPAHDGDVINSITVTNVCCGTYRQACPFDLDKPRPLGSSCTLLQRARPTAIQLVVSVFVILSRTETASLLASKPTSSTVRSISTKVSLPLKVKFILL